MPSPFKKLASTHHCNHSYTDRVVYNSHFVHTELFNSQVIAKLKKLPICVKSSYSDVVKNSVNSNSVQKIQKCVFQGLEKPISTIRDKHIPIRRSVYQKSDREAQWPNLGAKQLNIKLNRASKPIPCKNLFQGLETDHGDSDGRCFKSGKYRAEKKCHKSDNRVPHKHHGYNNNANRLAFTNRFQVLQTDRGDSDGPLDSHGGRMSEENVHKSDNQDSQVSHNNVNHTTPALNMSKSKQGISSEHRNNLYSKNRKKWLQDFQLTRSLGTKRKKS